MTRLRIPVSTYRLQFNRDFRLADARFLVPYLHDLGVSDLYASPLLGAKPGSPHGYDVTDPTRFNPELGGQADFAALAGELRQKEMGLLLDIVPNHMAAGSENAWWGDVLRRGRDSPYAGYFDIDWHSAVPGLAGRVLVPVLGEPFGKVLENRELTLSLAEDGFWVNYFDRRLPLSPASGRRILSEWLKTPFENPSAEHPVTPSIKVLLEKLEDPAVTGEKKWVHFYCHFWEMYRILPEVRLVINSGLDAFNGHKGIPGSFHRLEQILGEQAYRLAFWRTANEKINYRRFFDISDLVSLKVEEEPVFEATHKFILQLAKEGRVTGFRIDHIDGLHDPEAYLARLQRRLTGNGRETGFYVIAEKILSEDELLPAGWQVFGTTGYDFMNKVNGLFVDESGTGFLNKFYTDMSGIPNDFAAVVYNQKRRVLSELFAGELRNLGRQLSVLAAEDRYGRDLAIAALEQAILEVSSSLSVYRTYITGCAAAETDREVLGRAIAESVRRYPALEPAVSFLGRVLLMKFPDNLPQERKQAWLSFVMRWQQVTGPVMAKGFEDTSLYVCYPLLSLNEVGGTPGSPGTSAAEFHRWNGNRQKSTPCTMNASSTHDSKRSEDVRARINVLSEIPEEWVRRVERWWSWNETKKPLVRGCPVPDRNAEYLIYQTMVGAWPLRRKEIPSFRTRLQEYLVKAARESKLYTSWLDPDKEYEEGLKKFTASILKPGKSSRFLPDFIEFQRITAFYGALNSMAQLLLKVTCPGIPDFYQGTEIWNFSLVDPDNRRPVDFKKRRKLLTRLIKEETGGQRELAEELLASWEDGRIKMYLTYKALHSRRNFRELFAGGDYIPLQAAGVRSEHVFAFARRLGFRWFLTAVPRLSARMQIKYGHEKINGDLPVLRFPTGEAAWGENTILLPGQAPVNWQNIITGRMITAIPAAGDSLNIRGGEAKALPLAGVFEHFPVALLAGV